MVPGGDKYPFKKQYTYDSNKNLESIRLFKNDKETGATTYKYDDLRRKIQKTDSWSGGSETTLYIYNTNGYLSQEKHYSNSDTAKWTMYISMMPISTGYEKK